MFLDFQDILVVRVLLEQKYNVYMIDIDANRPIT